ncbi:proline iminopeptidase [Sanghuangporus baumii]|uniref:Proline iminopeptidase n=1 Tax=Sanghuangporus baumii TaxID=108892 RepID=A0A9Q5N3N7_SANBA|nr:proline iminopeptidase [Sanghuangporus baumii]
MTSILFSLRLGFRSHHKLPCNRVYLSTMTAQLPSSERPKQSLSCMYPAISPYKVDYLKVSDLHTLYYDISGNKNGTPVVFLHGGPGGGCDEQDRCFFNPEKYKAIRHVKYSNAGSTLSLAYAESHPDRVKSLVLRGIFTLRRSELEFFYQSGASHLFPEAWDEFVEPIPESERKDMILAYHAQLNAVDKEVRIRAAKAWSKWEMWTSKLYVDPDYIARATEDDWANAFARIENHYFVNGGFMRDGQLLEQQETDKIRHIPTIVVQGRYDVVCPITTAWALKKVFPEIELHIVPDAGHSAREPAIAKLLVEAANKFADL